MRKREEETGRAFGFNAILPLKQGEVAEGRWSVYGPLEWKSINGREAKINPD